MVMITRELQSYIERYIIPVYQTFDAAHQVDHVEQVIQNSLDIAQLYNVDLDIVYTIAAYHDIGLIYGRADHETASRRIIERDASLPYFFSSDTIQLIGEAAEDHRASTTYEPRSLYGKIIAEADRDIDFDRLLYRTTSYTQHYYPDYSIEKNYHHVYKYFQAKYGADGTVKLWLKYDKNLRNLFYIKKMLADNQAFQAAHESIFIQAENNLSIKAQ